MKVRWSWGIAVSGEDNESGNVKGENGRKDVIMWSWGWGEWWDEEIGIWVKKWGWRWGWRRGTTFKTCEKMTHSAEKIKFLKIFNIYRN